MAMTDQQLADLIERMIASAVANAPANATTGQLVAGGFGFLEAEGIAVTRLTSACIGVAIDRVLEIRAAQRAMAGAAKA